MATRTALERTLVIVAAIAIVASLGSLAAPFARDGLPSGHDATAHITYTSLFDRALSQGQMPVRWVEWPRTGESQPLFNFYPPGLYYLVGAVHAAGVPLSIALKATILLLWWCGALFTFAWLRRLGRLPAALAAVLFALSPYVIVDVFVRASYPELAAMMFAPAVLWSIDRVIRSSRPVDGLALAGFVCAMLLCHLLTSLIFAPVLAAYAVYRLSPAPTARRVGILTLGGVLGLAMAAFYVVPSMLELDLVAIGRMTSGDADYRRHFVGPSQWFSRTWGYGASVPGPGDGMPFQIDTVQWLVLGLAIAGLAAVRRAGGHRLSHAGGLLTFWLVVVFSAMFVMTEYAAPLWQRVAALQYLQFPWRYFMVISVGTAALAAILLSSVNSRTAQALLVIGVVAMQYQLHHEHLRPERYFPRQAIDIDRSLGAEVASGGIPPFIERGFTPVDAREPAPAGAGRWTVVAGEADVRGLDESDDRLALAVEAATHVRIRINTHYFPGWSVSIDGRPAGIFVDPRYGFMEVGMPGGTHTVRATFTNTPVRSAANAASGASIVLCLGGLAWSVWLRFRESSATHPAV